jgi:hypothetical protein
VEVAGITYVGSQSKYVPYVIEVNGLGEAVAVGRAQLAAPADPRVVRASLASFIASARLVTPDVSVQRDAIFRVNGMLQTKDPATAQMNQWFNGSKDSSPLVRSAKLTVNTGHQLDAANFSNILARDNEGPGWQSHRQASSHACHGRSVHIACEHARARIGYSKEPAWDLRPRLPLAGGLGKCKHFPSLF